MDAVGALALVRHYGEIKVVNLANFVPLTTRQLRRSLSR
jgi:hypothetical protein